MAKKTKKAAAGLDKLPENAHIMGSGLVEAQQITSTLETNYMP